jgi:hypothetical protein
MSRFGFALVFVASGMLSGANLHAQYPPPPGYGYGNWGGGGGTAASNNMNGMANMISAKGSYNLQSSQAAINMTQAQSQEIANHQQYEQTYFSMREENSAARERERGPRPTQEQLARIAADGVPKPLSPGDMDQITGAVNWPDVLQDDIFADGRKEVEALLAKKAANGRLGFTDQAAARKDIDGMYEQLKGIIKLVPPVQYIAGKDFLRSLDYSMAKGDL